MHRRLASNRIVIATHNPGKLSEMGELLAFFAIAAVSVGELGLAEPDETGTTYAENAGIKARLAAEGSGLPALADDSGLAVDALDGAPGVFSARWAGPGRDFRAAMMRVNTELRHRGAIAPARRKAHFVAALCLAWPDGDQATFEGRVFGRLVWPPVGDKGFGYDAMFRPSGFRRTFGEMSSAEKHAIVGWDREPRGLSHRARAFVALAQACLPIEQAVSKPETKTRTRP